jgi:DnaK suppressor protein
MPRTKQQDAAEVEGAGPAAPPAGSSANRKQAGSPAPAGAPGVNGAAEDGAHDGGNATANGAAKATPKRPAAKDVKEPAKDAPHDVKAAKPGRSHAEAPHAEERHAEAPSAEPHGAAAGAASKAQAAPVDAPAAPVVPTGPPSAPAVEPTPTKAAAPKAPAKPAPKTTAHKVTASRPPVHDDGDDEPREQFYERQRALLLAERHNYTRQAEELTAQAAALALEHEPGDVQFDEEGGEGGTANVDRELDLHLSAQAQAAIEEIDAALAKIEVGTYGTCESCGNPVPKARLEAIPHARLCVTCKSGGLSARRQ